LSRPLLPPYIDGLIAAYRAGQVGRDLHLGYWDRPPDLATPCAPGEFSRAQRHLTERMLAAVPIRPGQRLLDIACGLGGALAALAAGAADITLVGLNLDRRQLEICRDIAPPVHGSLSLVEGDACALPFVPESFDHVLCVEAMFHFQSRQIFLGEAAGLLRPGGTLVISDILLHRPRSAAPWDEATISAVLRRDYGPWPDPWIKPQDLIRVAAQAGLDLTADENWTAQTLPSYRTVAPHDRPERRRDPDAGIVLRWLHAAGSLSYRMLAFRRR
jgi:cyclopropane fatty-acyl-phospholipid synthase-like methyltransferase